jgi:endo-1,4-beta-xylanase
MTNTIYDKRMVDAEITIKNGDQIPQAGQEVSIRQTNHKFLFGTAAFDLVPLINDEYSGKQKEQAAERADKLLSLFNAATLPFYWAKFEPERGKPRTTELRNTAQWCKDRHLIVKGHPLCWHTLTADWMLAMDTDDILQAQLRRIQRDVSDFRGLIDMWDVINEVVIMPIFNKYDNGITRLCQKLGRINLVKSVFEAARNENPSATLLLNDFETSPAYDILIEGCLAAGIKIDAIGIQSHMHQGYWGVEKTQEILERFSRFNLPIHFTETTLVSGRLMPPEIVDLNDYQVQNWPSTVEGEERQAREAVLHYSTLFAHPLVQSITWWDLSDGNWLNAPAGLLRRDGSKKPAFDELHKLIKGEWWVSPKQLATDVNGKIRFTGFPGEYELTVFGQTRPFSLEKPGIFAADLIFASEK